LRNADHKSTTVLITGVCGTGKTTIGTALAAHLAIPFLDADDFHPAGNLQKMTAGMPLDNDDRAPWLAAITDRISESVSLVLACSALKESYRAQLQLACPSLKSSISLLRKKFCTLAYTVCQKFVRERAGKSILGKV
jgi:carbohydrate kinase (thermoresistant glucokinase family)